jgi:hypothetical protein
MSSLTTWMKRHSATVSLLAVIGLAVLAGLAIALVFIAVMSVWWVL